MNDIEAWLAWAFREELPRLGSGKVADAGLVSSFQRWRNLVELGVEIDHMNRFWCEIDHSAERDPHPSALVIGKAVTGLADVYFDAPEGYDLLADIRLADGTSLSDTERADAMARGIARARLDLGRMPGAIIRHAMLGTAPDWAAEDRYVRRMVLGPKGAPRWFREIWRQEGEGRPAVRVEVEGYDRVRCRPFRGAYRKTEVAPDLAGLVADRADYQAWVLTLNKLSADIGAAIGETVERSNRPLWPWESIGSTGFDRAENRHGPRVWLAESDGEEKLSTRAA